MKSNLLLAVVFLAVTYANAQHGLHQQCPKKCTYNDTNNGNGNDQYDVWIEVNEIRIQINHEHKFVAYMLKDLIFFHWEHSAAGIFLLDGTGYIVNDAGRFIAVEAEVTVNKDFYDLEANVQFFLKIQGKSNLLAAFEKTVDVTVLLNEIRSYEGELDFKQLLVLKEHQDIAEKMSKGKLLFSYYQRVNDENAALGLLGVILNVFDTDLAADEQWGALIVATAECVNDARFYQDWVSTLKDGGDLTIQQLHTLALSWAFNKNYEVNRKLIIAGDLQVIIRSITIDQVLYTFLFARAEKYYFLEIKYTYKESSYKYGYIYDGKTFSFINYATGYGLLINGKGSFIWINFKAGVFYNVYGLTLRAAYSETPSQEIIDAWNSGYYTKAIDLALEASNKFVVRRIDMVSVINSIIAGTYNEAQEFWAGIVSDIKNAAAAGLKGFEIAVGAVLRISISEATSVVGELFEMIGVAFVKLRGFLNFTIVELVIKGVESFANGFRSVIETVITTIIQWVEKGSLSISGFYQLAKRLASSVSISGALQWNISRSGEGGVSVT